MKLRIQFKHAGRSYAYNGQDLSNSAWYILDEDDVKYDTYEDYEEAHKPKEEEIDEPKDELTPQQKAAITRAANKAAKEEEEEDKE